MQVHDTRIIGWGSQVLDALIKMPKSKVLKIFPMKVMDLNRNSQLQISTRVRLWTKDLFLPSRVCYISGNAAQQVHVHRLPSLDNTQISSCGYMCREQIKWSKVCFCLQFMLGPRSKKISVPVCRPLHLTNLKLCVSSALHFPQSFFKVSLKTYAGAWMTVGWLFANSPFTERRSNGCLSFRRWDLVILLCSMQPWILSCVNP